nr:hypothetical protein [Lentzea cavernae]
MVTVIMGTVVGLTFLFGFGNVLNLALRLGVTPWVAPLIAPAVDLSILGLVLALRHLALVDAPPDLLQPARRLLIFASTVSLALNVAEPLIDGQYGKAAFDAVGPLLLIGWAEVGPNVLGAINVATPSMVESISDVETRRCLAESVVEAHSSLNPGEGQESLSQQPSVRATYGHPIEQHLDRAREEDVAHRAEHQKPISAENLRARLRIGAIPARQLVKIIRAEFDASAASDRVGGMPQRDAESLDMAGVA